MHNINNKVNAFEADIRCTLVFIAPFTSKLLAFLTYLFDFGLLPFSYSAVFLF